jgi:hypothetical protein
VFPDSITEPCLKRMPAVPKSVRPTAFGSIRDLGFFDSFDLAFQKILIVAPTIRRGPGDLSAMLNDLPLNCVADSPTHS